MSCADACALLAAAAWLLLSAVSITRAELGRRLFFDPLLSSDSSISCASCHKPERAFADDLALSKGVGGAVGTRNTPSVMNSTARVAFFWDGRAGSLEQQAIFPIENPVEMNLPIAQALERINADTEYARAFAQYFGGAATAKSLGAALAAYEKTLETADSPYDRYQLGDRGRAAVTGQARDEGMFKVPSSRNVAVTAPYMHNGMFAKLRDVLDYYNDPDRRVSGSVNRDAKLDRPLGLTAAELDDLQAFVESLTDQRFR